MLAWLIGCSTDGISKEMLAKTKDALKLLNDLTSDGNVGDDYYQAPDLAASMNRNLVDFRPFFKAKENISLITTGYKIRQAHDEAFCDLRACQLRTITGRGTVRKGQESRRGRIALTQQY